MNKTYNLYINSSNRSKQDYPYNFSIFINDDEIKATPNQMLNINVAGFYMINSMYNINSNSSNNTFILEERDIFDALISSTTITIPYGNYSVITLKETLNQLLNTKISVSYNIATNTYTFKSLDNLQKYYIDPNNCSKFLGIFTKTEILSTGTTGTYINMINFSQVIIKCPSLSYEKSSLDNIKSKGNFLSIGDILFTINKQDVEPFRSIYYNNQDGSTVFSYNIINTQINNLTFVLVNEYDEYITDAPDYFLHLQISVIEKNEPYYKEVCLQVLSLLNDIHFGILHLISIFRKFKISFRR
jgi:hypothetical protein